jgi:hypothetical protein
VWRGLGGKGVGMRIGMRRKGEGHGDVWCLA